MHAFGELLDMLDRTFVRTLRVYEHSVKLISGIECDSILYFDLDLMLQSILANQISHDVRSVYADLNSHYFDLLLGVC